jgi:hypothetical protein
VWAATTPSAPRADSTQGNVDLGLVVPDSRVARVFCHHHNSKIGEVVAGWGPCWAGRSGWWAARSTSRSWELGRVGGSRSVRLVAFGPWILEAGANLGGGTPLWGRFRSKIRVGLQDR